MAERVQKVLSQWGIASRRKAEKMILAGRVRINGQLAQLGDRVDLTTDQLLVDGKVIQNSQRPELTYLLVNKPTSVVSTCDDPQRRRTVLDLLPPNVRHNQGIHPVGRLDYASSGALLLTNDGALTLALTHPRYHLPKTYLVQLNRPPRNRDLQHWREGILLDGRSTLPAQVHLTSADSSKTTIEVILREGRNRQIRRVAQKLGYQVIKLHRQAIASINLTLPNGAELASGKYRHLEPTEITLLKKAIERQISQETIQAGGVRGE